MVLKNKNIYINQLIKLFIIVLVLCLTNINKALSQSNKNKKWTVVIDPGHGGKDPGAHSAAGKEKDVVLAVGLKLGKYITNNMPDVKVIYTRSTDEFIELYRRARIANENHANLFISIHANSNPSPKPLGFETYVMGLHKTKGNLMVAKKENSVILKEDDYQNQYDGFDPNSPEANIIFSLYQNQYLAQSLDFAALVQKQAKEHIKRYDRGVKQAGFLVLWRTTMPSVLIEVGFISNPVEGKYITSEEGQNNIASGIYRAFKEYKQKYDVNSDKNQQIKSDDSKVVNNNAQLKKEKIKDVYFTIQLSTSSTKLDTKPENFKGLKDVYCIQSGKYYKYYSTKTSDYNKIVEVEKLVKDKYKDAFIIAFENDKKISVKQARKKLNE